MCLYHVLFEFKIFIENYFKTYHPSIFVVVISLCEDLLFIRQHMIIQVLRKMRNKDESAGDSCQSSVF